MHRQQPLRSNEFGGVLITGLLTLIVLTTIGFMATRSSIMENEIVVNERNYKEAFYAADLGAQNAEDIIQGLPDVDEYTRLGAGFKDEVLPHPGDMPGDETVLIEATHDDFHALPPSPTGSPSLGAIVPQRYAENPRFSVWNMYDGSINVGRGAHNGINYFTIATEATGARREAKGYTTTTFARRFSDR